MAPKGRQAKKKFVPVVKEAPQSSSPVHGRGASWSPANRFERLHVDLTDNDVVDIDPNEEERPRRETQFFRDGTKTIIARNSSPDVGFETSLNPYRGCEHGCIYCFSRPTHETKTHHPPRLPRSAGQISQSGGDHYEESARNARYRSARRAGQPPCG